MVGSGPKLLAVSKEGVHWAGLPGVPEGEEEDEAGPHFEDGDVDRSDVGLSQDNKPASATILTLGLGEAKEAEGRAPPDIAGGSGGKSPGSSDWSGPRAQGGSLEM